MIQAKKRASLMKRRVIASIIGLSAVIALLIAMVIVQSMVKITPWDDVDGTRYYIRQRDGVYGLYDEDKVELTKESIYKYYVTKQGTLVQIDAQTGALGEVITVDNIFTAQDSEVENTRTHRVQIFPHVEQKNILTIEVHNEHGSFTFQRFNTVTNKVDKTASFVLKDSVTTAYDPELFAELYVDAGYTLATMKLKDPIKDENGNFSEYGLVAETRTRKKLDENGKVMTDENGNELTEEYRYEPAYFILTDIDGNRHKVIVGDPLLTGQGFYVQYVDVSGKEEVKRDAVYVLDNTLQKSVLSRVEDFLTPMITYPLGMMTYTDVQNFIIHEMEDLRDEDGNPIYKPSISFSFVDFAERENTQKAAYPYVFDDVEFMNEIRSMKGYHPHTNNINATLRNLYSPEYVNIITLNPSHEEMVEYGLYELVVDKAGNPILDKNGEKQYSPASKYTLSFDYTVEDGESADIYYTHNHMLLISEKPDSDNYYVYSIIKTTGYEKQDDGSLKKIKDGITYSYNIIVEIAGHSLNFVEWDTMKWVSQSIFQDNIAFIEQIDIVSPDYNASFKLDNSESDKTNLSSNYLKVKAKDSKGRNLTTFNFLKFKDKTEGDGGPYTWLITANDIQVFNNKGEKAAIKDGVAHYEYDALGNQVLVIGTNGGKISGTKVWVHANEIVAGDTTYSRYSTTLFRLFYQTLFYTEIANTYDVTADEEATLTSEDNLILKMRVKTKDRDGRETTNVYAFYRISARKAYITINGNGGFYVQANRVEKILSDVEKFFTNQPIDPLAKS